MITKSISILNLNVPCYNHCKHCLLSWNNKLLESNIEKLEKQGFEETFKDLKNMDEKYYSTIPSFKELLKIYCDKSDNYLYSKKDLYLVYRKKFIKENNIIIDDISDERFSGSVRF